MTRSCAGTSHIAAPTEQYYGPRSADFSAGRRTIPGNIRLRGRSQRHSSAAVKPVIALSAAAAQ
ncbi:hypothetical protein DMH17_05920 [Raoultella planticola]|nr:hypothetical protein [Raoultella planticola]